MSTFKCYLHWEGNSLLVIRFFLLKISVQRTIIFLWHLRIFFICPNKASGSVLKYTTNVRRHLFPKSLWIIVSFDIMCLKALRRCFEANEETCRVCIIMYIQCNAYYLTNRMYYSLIQAIHTRSLIHSPLWCLYWIRQLKSASFVAMEIWIMLKPCTVNARVRNWSIIKFTRLDS
jgi:hypothetical protein